MKPTSTGLFFIVLIARLAQAYKLDITFADGVKAKASGDWPSPCQDFPSGVDGKQAVRMEFDRGQHTSEFYVWSGKNCGGHLVLNKFDGNYEVSPNSVVGSFKIA